MGTSFLLFCLCDHLCVNGCNIFLVSPVIQQINYIFNTVKLARSIATEQS